MITLHHYYNRLILSNRQRRHNSHTHARHAVYRTQGLLVPNMIYTWSVLVELVSCESCSWHSLDYEPSERVYETGPVWIPRSYPATARRGVTRAARLQPTRVPRVCVGWVLLLLLLQISSHGSFVRLFVSPSVTRRYCD